MNFSKIHFSDQKRRKVLTFFFNLKSKQLEKCSQFVIDREWNTQKCSHQHDATSQNLLFELKLKLESGTIRQIIKTFFFLSFHETTFKYTLSGKSFLINFSINRTGAKTYLPNLSTSASTKKFSSSTANHFIIAYLFFCDVDEKS